MTRRANNRHEYLLSEACRQRPLQPIPRLTVSMLSAKLEERWFTDLRDSCLAEISVRYRGSMSSPMTLMFSHGAQHPSSAINEYDLKDLVKCKRRQVSSCSRRASKYFRNSRQIEFRKPNSILDRNRPDWTTRSLSPSSKEALFIGCESRAKFERRLTQGERLDPTEVDLDVVLVWEAPNLVWRRETSFAHLAGIRTPTAGVIPRRRSRSHSPASPRCPFRAVSTQLIKPGPAKGLARKPMAPAFSARARTLSSGKAVIKINGAL